MNSTLKASVIAALIVVVYSHFIFAPLFMAGFKHIFIHKLSNLSDARNYYTVISSISTIVTSLAGIFLGYHYFMNKKINDRANIIIDQLNKYDESIDDILNLRVDSQEALDQKRQKVERNFEIIECIIDNNTSLLNFSQNDLNEILRVNSFVDKNDTIMRANFEDLKAADLKTLKSEYIGKIQEARKICYLKTQ